MKLLPPPRIEPPYPHKDFCPRCRALFEYDAADEHQTEPRRRFWQPRRVLFVVTCPACGFDVSVRGAPA